MRDTIVRYSSVALRSLAIATVLAFSASAPSLASPLDLGAYKGKVVYLDFWASWCTPCRLSFPWMNEVQHAYGAKGLVVVAVNVDHDKDLADAFLQRNGADFKIVYDTDGQIAQQFDFKDMPTTILIGRDGKVRYVHDGFFPDHEGQYASHIAALVNEKAP